MASYDKFIESVQTQISQPEKLRVDDIRTVEDLHQEANSLLSDILQSFKNDQHLNIQKAHEIVKRLVLFARQKPYLMASAVRFKQHHNYHCVHTINTCMLSIAICVKMNLSVRETVEVGLAAILSNIAMVQIPDEILEKEGELLEEELQLIQSHVQTGYDFLKEQATPLSEEILNGILHHHERQDGSGYPNHLTKKDISRSAKIISVADTYDSITSRKQYRDHTSHTKTLKVLYNMADVTLSKFIIKQLVSLLGVYPVSTAVRLSTGELSIVFDVNQKDLFRPKVLIFTDTDGQSTIPTLLNLSEEKGIEITNILAYADFHVDPHSVITAFIAMQT